MPRQDGGSRAVNKARRGPLRRWIQRQLLEKVLRPPVIAFGKTRAIQYVAPGVRALDRGLLRRSAGRTTAVGLAGLPSLVLNVTGRKSGALYNVPLLCLPWGESYLIVGSNFGRKNHPEWTANLLANPCVTVSIRGKEIQALARLLRADERDAVWPALVDNWPGYKSYARRLDRELRVFALDPIATRTGSNQSQVLVLPGAAIGAGDA